MYKKTTRYATPMMKAHNRLDTTSTSDISAFFVCYKSYNTFLFVTQQQRTKIISFKLITKNFMYIFHYQHYLLIFFTVNLTFVSEPTSPSNETVILIHKACSSPYIIFNRDSLPVKWHCPRMLLFIVFV